jgi:amino acid permease
MEMGTKVVQDAHDPTKIGEFKSIVNLVLTAVGVGVLTLPRAIAQSGWVVGILLLAATWSLSQYTMHLLWKCVQSQRSKGNLTIESYGGIGAAALGKYGRIIVSFSMYIGLSAICVIIIILLGSGLFNLTGSMSRTSWIKISALCILPLSWLPSLKEVGVLSAVGVVATCLVSFVILVAAAVRDSDEKGEVSATPVSAGAFAMSYIEFMNSFTVAPVIPTIICGMRDPSRYPRVALYGFAIISGLFAIIGFSGYIGWGDQLLKKKGGNITDLIADSASKTYSTICQVSIIIVALSHFLVMFNPVALLSDSTVRKIPETKTSSVAKMGFQIFARSGLVGLMLLAALYVPSFGTVVDLVAATVVLPLQVIFPIVFFEILCRDEIATMSALMRNVMRTTFVAAIGLALVTMAYGMYNVVTTWSAH